MKARCYFLVLILMMVLAGCGKTDNPVAPSGVSDVPGSILNDGESIHSGFPPGNRILWGLWKVKITEDAQIHVVPDRTGALHLNAVRLLEVAPCTTCLMIHNLQFLPDDELQVDLRIRHPFPGILKFSGFDVRGIFISGADYTFPSSGRSIARGPDIPRMLNPDGYTALFNPTDYPETIPPALGYIPGLKATGGDLSATLNPYVAYEQDKPRCMFEPGAVSTRKVHIFAPSFPIEFGYAVDANWQLVDEVIDPIEDFPPDANCIEAYKINVQIGDGLELTAGGMTDISVEVFDHQGLETIDGVTVEAPGIFAGEVELGLDSQTGDESWLYTGQISNETGAGGNDYPVLVMVTDTWTDQNLGAVYAYQVVNVYIGGIGGQGWARTWGGSGSDWGWEITEDGFGNVYVVGEFQGTVDFDPGEGIDIHSANSPYYDVFLCKYDWSGSFHWALTWGGIDHQEATDVCVDGSGNVYVSGWFIGIVDFDPGDGTDYRGHPGEGQAYLSKFDPDGNFIRVRTWEPGYEFGGSSGISAIYTDADNNVLITGYYDGTVDFDPGPGTDIHTAAGSFDAFLCKLDSSGSYQWVRTWGGPSVLYTNDIAPDNIGNIIIAGSFKETADFDPGPGIENHTSNGELDIFLIKFDSSGLFQWVKTWGGPGDEYSPGLAVDTDGFAYITGWFLETVDFDPGPGSDFHTSNGDRDVFLSRLDSSGNLVWVLTWGGTGRDGSRNCALDADGNIYVSGLFEGTVDFDPGPGIIEYSSNGGMDIFLSKLNYNGDLLWVRAWGGLEQDYSAVVAVDYFGNAYITGGFMDTVDFNPGPGIDNHSSNGSRDAFLTRFRSDGYW